MSAGGYFASDDEGVISLSWPKVDGKEREVLTMAWEQDTRVMHNWKNENFEKNKRAVLEFRLLAAEAARGPEAWASAGR